MRHLQQVSQSEKNRGKTDINFIVLDITPIWVALPVFELSLFKSMRHADISDGPKQHVIVESEQPQPMLILHHEVPRSQVMRSTHKLRN